MQGREGAGGRVGGFGNGLSNDLTQSFLTGPSGSVPQGYPSLPLNYGQPGQQLLQDSHLEMLYGSMAGNSLRQQLQIAGQGINNNNYLNMLAMPAQQQQQGLPNQVQMPPQLQQPCALSQTHSSHWPHQQPLHPLGQMSASQTPLQSGMMTPPQAALPTLESQIQQLAQMQAQLLQLQQQQQHFLRPQPGPMVLMQMLMQMQGMVEPIAPSSSAQLLGAPMQHLLPRQLPGLPQLGGLPSGVNPGLPGSSMGSMGSRPGGISPSPLLGGGGRGGGGLPLVLAAVPAPFRNTPQVQALPGARSAPMQHSISSRKRFDQPAEMKSLKRKECNRESARRSRLRKLAENEDMDADVDLLISANDVLHDQLNRLLNAAQLLQAHNDAMQEGLSLKLCQRPLTLKVLQAEAQGAAAVASMLAGHRPTAITTQQAAASSLPEAAQSSLHDIIEVAPEPYEIVDGCLVGRGVERVQRTLDSDGSDGELEPEEQEFLADINRGAGMGPLVWPAYVKKETTADEDQADPLAYTDIARPAPEVVSCAAAKPPQHLVLFEERPQESKRALGRSGTKGEVVFSGLTGIRCFPEAASLRSRQPPRGAHEAGDEEGAAGVEVSSSIPSNPTASTTPNSKDPTTTPADPSDPSDPNLVHPDDDSDGRQ